MYELKKNTREIKDRADIAEGCTLDQQTQEPEIIKSFEKKEDALEELKEYRSTVQKIDGWNGTFYAVTEYYVEQNEYDEYGEWSGGGDIWEFAEMEGDAQ